MTPQTRSITLPRAFALALALAAVAVISLVGAASAQALTVTGTAQPANLAAGAHSNVNVNVSFGPADQNVDDLRIGLPPGLIGDPTATPLCSVAQLNADGCPAASQVGTVTANATVTVIALPLTLDVNGTLYNLQTQPGEPARFGIVLRPIGLPAPLPPILPPVILQSAVELRPDFGLDTVVNDIPEVTPSPLGDLPTHINSMSLTLQGTAANGQPFMRNPTSCSLKTTTFTASPHPPATGTATDTDSFTPTSCGALPFSPGFSARVGAPGQTGPGTLPPVTTTIVQDANEAGLASAEVFLPPVLGSNIAALGAACSESDFQAGNCPPATEIGSAIASSAVLTDPLIGPVVLVEPAGVGLPDIGLDLRGQLPLKLKGEFLFGTTTGVGFHGLPDIPILVFQLRFNPNGLVVSDVDLCATPAVFQTTFVAHSGATQSGPATAGVDGCGPAAGPAKGGAKKCKKAKKKRKKAARKDAAAAKKRKKAARKDAAAAKKKPKKRRCKKRKRKKRR